MKKVLAAVMMFAALMTACGGGGNSSNTGGTPTTQAPIVGINSSLTSIVPGQSTTIMWTTTNATSASLSEQVASASVSSQSAHVLYTAVQDEHGCTIYGDTDHIHSEKAETAPITAAEAVGLSGSKTVTPSKTTTYTITATGAGGSKSASVTIYVQTNQYNGDQLIKEYQIDYSFQTLPNAPASWKATTRWDVGYYIDVYDETNSPVLQQALDAWNAVLGTVFLRKSTDPNSLVKVTLKSDMPAGRLGEASWQNAGFITGQHDTYRIIGGHLYIHPTAINFKGLYVHELGHMLGFFKHTTGDGVMDAYITNDAITPLVYTMMHRLYELPVDTVIP